MPSKQMTTDNNMDSVRARRDYLDGFSYNVSPLVYPVDLDGCDAIRGNTRGDTRGTSYSFFTKMGHVLPCRFCRESHLVSSAEIPIEKYIDSRENLIESLFPIHYKVHESSLQSAERYARPKSLERTEPA